LTDQLNGSVSFLNDAIHSIEDGNVRVQVIASPDFDVTESEMFNELLSTPTTMFSPTMFVTVPETYSVTIKFIFDADVSFQTDPSTTIKFSFFGTGG